MGRGIDRIKLLLRRSRPDKNSVILKIVNMLKIIFYDSKSFKVSKTKNEFIDQKN